MWHAKPAFPPRSSLPGSAACSKAATQPFRLMRTLWAPPRLRELEKRVRDLERMLGKKTMEAEILKEALDLARPKKRTSPLLSWSNPEDDIQ